MKKLILLFAISFVAQISSAQKNESTTEQKSIYFATAKHAISPESEAVLNDILPFLQQFDTYEITIQGNTDDKGNTQYNQALSERRANAVKKYLQERGIDETKLRIAAYGEEKPLADNADDEGKQKNRRVDIYITGVKKAIKKAIVKIDEPKSVVEIKLDEPKEEINDLYRLLANKPQEFEFDPKQNKAIVGTQGTIIYYQANSVETSCSKVKMRLKEVYKKSDMVLERLTTETIGGEILTTGGMVKTEIIDCNGKNLELKEKQQILIVMPSPTPIDMRMKLFNGQIHTSKNPHQDSTIFWNLAKNGGGSPRGDDVCIACMKPTFKQIIAGIFSRSQYFTNKRNRICVANYKLELKREPFKKETMRLDLKRRLQQKTLSKQDSIKQGDADTKNEKILVDIIRNKKMIDTLKTVQGQSIRKLARIYDLKKLQKEAKIYSLCERLGFNNEIGNLIKDLDIGLDKNGNLNIAALQDSLSAKQASMKDVNQYVFPSDKLGWANCDFFSNFAPNLIVNIDIQVKPAKNIDCKLVFEKTILPITENGNIYFTRTLKKLPTYIIGLKYEKKQAYLALKKITLTANSSQELDFQAMSLDEIRTKLLAINN